MIGATAVVLAILTNKTAWISVDLSGHKSDFYAFAAPVGAALFGFIGAAAAIIASSQPLARIKANDFFTYATMTASYRDSMFASLAATSYCTLAFLFDRDPAEPYSAIVGVALMMLAFLRAYRATRRLHQTMNFP